MILIAGGTGTLGSRTARKLLGRGDEVRVMTRDPHGDRAEELRTLGAEVVAGDVRDEASLRSAVSGASQLVVSIQGLAGSDARANNPRTCDRVGVRGLIGTAHSEGVAQVVYVSIAGACPDASPEFVRIKCKTEQVARESGMTWTIIRPSAFMEVWGPMLGGPVIKGETAMVFGDGDNPVNFVSADDVAEFVVLALTDPSLSGDTLTLGGPQDFTLNEVVDLFAKTANVKAKVRKTPVAMMLAMSRLMSLFNPGLSRQMDMGAWMATTDQRVDMTALNQRFPFELVRLQDVAAEMVSEARAQAN